MPQQTNYPVAILIFSLMALFLFFEMALQVSPGVMTVPLQQSLHLSAYGLGIMSACYYISYTFMQIPSGLLYDRANFRMLVTAAVLVCVVGAALFGFADSLLEGALARLLMGFGSAFAFLSVLTVAARYFPSRYFAMLTGIAQLLAALGGVAGALPIAWLVSKLDWQHALWVLAAFGAILALVIWVLCRKPPKSCDQQCRQESVGQSLKAIVSNKQTWTVAAYAIANWAPVTAFAALWGVPFLVADHHISVTTAGGLTALMWLGIGLTSPVIGYASDKVGSRKPLLLLTALLGAVSMGLIIYMPHLSLWLTGLLLFIAGIGSSGQILSFAVVKDNAEPKRVSTSIGFNNMAVVAGAIIVQPLIGKLLKWDAPVHEILHGHYTAGDFKHALLILPLCYVACVLITLLAIRETYCLPIGERNAKLASGTKD